MIKSPEDCAVILLAEVIGLIAAIAIMLAVWTSAEYYPCTMSGVIGLESEQVNVKK
jgi:hypothetical protein